MSRVRSQDPVPEPTGCGLCHPKDRRRATHQSCRPRGAVWRMDASNHAASARTTGQTSANFWLALRSVTARTMTRIGCRRPSCHNGGHLTGNDVRCENHGKPVWVDLSVPAQKDLASARDKQWAEEYTPRFEITLHTGGRDEQRQRLAEPQVRAGCQRR